MPFQSEKQRRYLHANHPEIAKRWEEEYATGGIANHFRKKFKEGSYSRSYNPGAGGVVQHGPVKTKTHHHGGNGGEGPPSVVHKPKGPTAAEIAAAKAAAAAKKKAIADAEHKAWITKKTKEKKKKVKHHSNIRPFGFTEYEKLIKPGLYDHYKKNLPSYDSEGVELRTERVLDNLDILKNIKKGGIKGNVNENISPFGQTFQTFNYKYDPYKPTSENFWEGYNTLVTPAGLNQAQTDYLDKVAKKGVVKESGQFFTYDKPTDVRAKLKELDEKSEEWIGTDVNPDKIVSGDPTTYATDKDVKEYLQKKYPGMQLKNDSGRTLAIDLATGGIANHFKFKDGGTPQLAKKSKDGTRPGYGGPQDWGQQERAEQQAAATGYAGSEGTGGYAGKSHAEMQSLSKASPSHGGMETEWSQSKEYKDAGYEPPGFTTEEKVETSKEWMEEEVIKVLKRNDLTKEQKRRQLQWQYEQMKKGYDTVNKLKKAAAVHPIVAVLVGLFEGNKAKKAQDEEIRQLEVKLGHLEDWDLKTRHHAVDTPYQILEQRILDLQQPRTRDDTTGDGGPTPIVVPAVIDEMADATGEIDMFDAWDRIKRNQALYAARQSADDTKVGEWVGDERLLVNSGGLANLFRVKNRN